MCAGLAYFLFGASGLLVLALMLPVAVCLYIMLKRKAPYFETALILSGLYAGILYLLINAVDLLAGNSAFYTLTELFKAMWNEYAELASKLPGVLDAQMLKAFRLFGSSLFAIGTKGKLSFTGSDIMLFDRKSGRRIVSGRLEIK